MDDIIKCALIYPFKYFFKFSMCHNNEEIEFSFILLFVGTKKENNDTLRYEKIR